MPRWSGRMLYSAVLAAQITMGLSPEPLPMLVDMFESMWIEKY